MTQEDGWSSGRGDGPAARGDLLTPICAAPGALQSVASRNRYGLFGVVELVRNHQTREPMAPFNGMLDGDGGARCNSSGRRGSHVRPLELLFHQPAADDFGGGAGKGSRSWIARWRLRIKLSPDGRRGGGCLGGLKPSALSVTFVG